MVASIGWPALQIKCDKTVASPDEFSFSFILKSSAIILIKVLLPKPGFPDIQNRHSSGEENQVQKQETASATDFSLV